MKKFAFFVIATFITTLAMAQEVNKTDAQGRKHGIWKKYFPNEQLRYEGRFDHGTEVDTFKFYFENGDLKAVNYFRGKGGVAYSWQYGGENRLAAEGKYINAKRDSVWTFYDIDGNVISRETYKNDKREGPAFTYFDTGRKAEAVHYVNDKKEGEWKQFYETGKPKTTGQYKDGSLQGEVVYYEANGKIGAKGKYVKGLMHGNWYFFDDKMEVEKKQVWRYGKMLSQDPPPVEEEDQTGIEPIEEGQKWQK